MSALGDHSFIIGFSAKVIFSNEEKDATETNQESNVAFFVCTKQGLHIILKICRRSRA